MFRSNIKEETAFACLCRSWSCAGLCTRTYQYLFLQISIFRSCITLEQPLPFASISQEHYLQKHHFHFNVLADCFGMRCIYHCWFASSRHQMLDVLWPTCCTDNTPKSNVKTKQAMTWLHMAQAGCNTSVSHVSCINDLPRVCQLLLGWEKHEMWVCDVLIFCGWGLNPRSCIVWADQYWCWCFAHTIFSPHKTSTNKMSYIGVYLTIKIQFNDLYTPAS